MKQECAREAEVLEAARSGNWTEELRAHVAGCEGCEDLALVVAAFGGDAERAAAGAEIPLADAIWERALAESRVQKARRALLPIAIAEKLGVAAGVLLAAGLAAWQFPNFETIRAAFAEVELTGGLAVLTPLLVMLFLHVWAEE